MHIQYSYTQGTLARMATSVYFATRGRDKVGFTLDPGDGDDPPRLVRGIRGALERNTMRYYLAFDAYLHALESPAPQRFEAKHRALVRRYGALCAPAPRGRGTTITSR